MKNPFGYQRQSLGPSTTLYRLGTPFRTPAVVLPLTADWGPAEGIPGFHTLIKDENLVLTLTLDDQDRVYGLGQHVGGLNKRGQFYRMFATDHSPRHPDSEVIYGSHPFLMVLGTQNFGFFVDYPGEVTFDIGFTHHDTLEICLPSAHADFYYFSCGSALEIVKEYLLLTGTPYVPPRWAFGYHQSRYGYRNEDDVRRIAGQLREMDLPCDAIYLDIDYMDDYKVFTVDRNRFPDMKKLSSDLRAQGFELVPIIDAAVKAEHGYPVDDQGRKNGYFCQDDQGKDFVCGVWPGASHLPDFLRAETRTWWADGYRFYFDLGIRGFWNDMNEPAIFYTEQELKRVANRVGEVFQGDKKAMEFIETLGDLGSVCHRREYYSLFFQKTNQGEWVNHEQVHNLYALTMVQAASEAFDRHLPDYRSFLISRSSSPGLHRYAGIWTGDNNSWWEHLRLHVRNLMSLGLMGFFYTGADIGGFGSNPSPELMVRWMQVGVFSPLFRNHTWYAARDQEPWSFGETFTPIFRRTLKNRYAFLPFLYSEFMVAVRSLKPLIRPLFTDFPQDQRAYGVEDQFLFGPSLLVAPVGESNARGRLVHLPPGLWAHWSLRETTERNLTILSGGDHYVEANLDRTPIFLRENSLVVLAVPGTHSGNTTVGEVTILGFVTDQAELDFYEDAGEGKGYLDDEFSMIRFMVKKLGSNLQVGVQRLAGGNWNPGVRRIHFEIFDTEGKRFDRTLEWEP